MIFQKFLNIDLWISIIFLTNPPSTIAGAGAINWAFVFMCSLKLILVLKANGILLRAFDLARHLSCRICKEWLAPWTTNMCLYRPYFLEKFLPVSSWCFFLCFYSSWCWVLPNSRIWKALYSGRCCGCHCCLYAKILQKRTNVFRPDYGLTFLLPW